MNEKLFRIFGFVTAIIACLFLIPWITIWLKKAKDANKVYSIVIYDVNGQILTLHGLRVNFRTMDVAWSFMKEYKQLYPYYDFGLVAIDRHSKPLMIKFL